MLPRRLLTRRELEVLVLLANGLHYAEVAQVLDLCNGTVKCHRQNIRKKLGIKTTQEAVLKAMNIARS